MEHVKVDQLEDGIARVLVSRGDIGNASSPEMLGEIRDAFALLSADRDVRAIIFAAEGRHFSVGADFAFLQRLTGASKASGQQSNQKQKRAEKAQALRLMLG